MKIINLKDMKKIATTLSLLLLCFLAGATGKIVTDSLQSKILGAQVKYNVYLPESFDTANKLYPVVYLLHGLGGDYRNWSEKTNLRIVADELIGSGEIEEMVIIMPNAGGKDRHKTWNGYFNMPGWNYEDFFFNELIPQVEQKYRIVSDKHHRAVMGLSMGGGGSTVYCQKHPDMFSSCFAMSAWLDNQNSEGGKYKENQDDKLYLVCKSVRENSTLDFFRNADEKTIANLKTISWFFDCGDDDSLLPYSVDLYLMMKKAGIRTELRVRNGKHNWEYWGASLRMALPFASRNFYK